MTLQGLCQNLDDFSKYVDRFTGSRDIVDNNPPSMTNIIKHLEQSFEPGSSIKGSGDKPFRAVTTCCGLTTNTAHIRFWLNGMWRPQVIRTWWTITPPK